MPPIHTPYDGSSKPFSIGLKPLNLAEWIEVGDDFDMYLAEKRRLYTTVPDKVFVEEPDTREAQREALGLVEASCQTSSGVARTVERLGQTKFGWSWSQGAEWRRRNGCSTAPDRIAAGDNFGSTGRVACACRRAG